MSDNFEKLAREWFLRAEDDWLSAKDILNDKEGAASTVCFLSQQIVEKYLKGYLVYKGVEFPKIHDLDKLVELCKAVDGSFLKIKKEAQELTDFYVAARYPGDYPQFTWENAENAFVSAEKVRNFVSDVLNLR